MPLEAWTAGQNGWIGDLDDRVVLGDSLRMIFPILRLIAL